MVFFSINSYKEMHFSHLFQDLKNIKHNENEYQSVINPGDYTYRVTTQQESESECNAEDTSIEHEKLIKLSFPNFQDIEMEQHFIPIVF